MKKFLLIFAIAFVLSSGAYFFIASQKRPSVDVPDVVFDFPNSSATQAQNTPAQHPDGWLQYKNSDYGFSLWYPPELTPKEYPRVGAMAVTFQNSDTQNAEGFQIFVTPYSDTKITTERFKEDEPSGVHNDQESATLDGIPAVTFYSTNISLGDTFEMWFINNGLLYEVTTLKPLDQWLGSIMPTWQFL